MIGPKHKERWIYKVDNAQKTAKGEAPDLAQIKDAKNHEKLALKEYNSDNLGLLVPHQQIEFLWVLWL